MARKPTAQTLAAPIEIDGAAVAESAGALTAIGEISRQFNDDFAELHQTIGMQRAFKAVSDLSTAGHLRQIQKLKESGTWKRLPVQIPGEGWRTVDNFHVFCEFGLGLAKSRVYEDLSFLSHFGDAFESLQRAGVTRTTLRALKHAGNPVLEDIKGLVVDVTDPDAMRDAIEDLVTKATAEKARADEAEATNAAKDELLAQKDAKINKLTAAKKRKPVDDPDDALIREFESDAIDATGEAAKLVNADFRAIAITMDETDWSQGDRLGIAQLNERVRVIKVQQLAKVANALRETAIAVGVAPADIGIADEAVMPDDFE